MSKYFESIREEEFYRNNPDKCLNCNHHRDDHIDDAGECGMPDCECDEGFYYEDTY